MTHIIDEKSIALQFLFVRLMLINGVPPSVLTTDGHGAAVFVLAYRQAGVSLLSFLPFCIAFTPRTSDTFDAVALSAARV